MTVHFQETFGDFKIKVLLAGSWRGRPMTVLRSTISVWAIGQNRHETGKRNNAVVHAGNEWPNGFCRKLALGTQGATHRAKP